MQCYPRPLTASISLTASRAAARRRATEHGLQRCRRLGCLPTLASPTPAAARKRAFHSSTGRASVSSSSHGAAPVLAASSSQASISSASSDGALDSDALGIHSAHLVETTSSSQPGNPHSTSSLLPDWMHDLIPSLADAFLALPDHLSPSSLGTPYTSIIIALTLLLRSSITLPITLWQRRRTRRVAELVAPRVKRWAEMYRYQLRAEYRRAGMSYQEYEKQFNKKVKEQFKSLASKNGCRTLPTLLVPPAVHLPVFITATLALREACARSSASLEALSSASASSSSSTSLIDSASTTMTILEHTSQLALESFAWCSSLAESDPTAALPLAVGLTFLANVEVQFAKRQRTAQAEQVLGSESATMSTSTTTTTLGDSNAAGQWQLPQHRQQQGARLTGNRSSNATRPTPVAHPATTRSTFALSNNNNTAGSSATGVRRYSIIGSTSTRNDTPALPSSQSQTQVMDQSSPRPAINRSQLAAKAMTNTLRIASIAFIPIAANVPVAVNIYWLTTNLFSIAQNLVFAYFDGRKR